MEGDSLDAAPSSADVAEVEAEAGPIDAPDPYDGGPIVCGAGTVSCGSPVVVCCSSPMRCMLSDATGFVRAIQELAGHASLSTTLRFMHLSPSTLDAAIRLFDMPAPTAALG